MILKKFIVINSVPILGFNCCDNGAFGRPTGTQSPSGDEIGRNQDQSEQYASQVRIDVPGFCFGYLLRCVHVIIIIIFGSLLDH